jgi:hypothetical protein
MNFSLTERHSLQAALNQFFNVAQQIPSALADFDASKSNALTPWCVINGTGLYSKQVRYLKLRQ